MIKVPMRPANTGKSAISILNSSPCEMIKLPIFSAFSIGSARQPDPSLTGIYLIRDNDFKTITDTIPLLSFSDEEKYDSDFYLMEDNSALVNCNINLLPVYGYPKALYRIVDRAYGEYMAQWRGASIRSITNAAGNVAMIPPARMPDPVYIMSVKDSCYSALSSIIDKMAVSPLAYNQAFYNDHTKQNDEVIDTSVLMNMIIGYEMLSDYLPK